MDLFDPPPFTLIATYGIWDMDIRLGGGGAADATSEVGPAPLEEASVETSGGTSWSVADGGPASAIATSGDDPYVE